MTPAPTMLDPAAAARAGAQARASGLAAPLPEGIAWFHSIDFGDGVRSRGRDGGTARKARRIALPASLAGKSVLDVGAWDGYFSFEAERRGAARVLATDWHVWGGHKDRKGAFEYARARLGSAVEDMDVDVLELSPERLGGQFDVVLFLGVLYHMRHPLLALERIADVAREHLILETETSAIGWSRKPAVRYFLEGDDWCAPNLAAVSAMLHDVGFREVKVVHRYGAPTRLARAAWWAARRDRGFLDSLQRGRAVVHAWK